MIRALQSILAKRRSSIARAQVIRDAQQRLAEMVETRRNSYELQSYRKHRAAALKGRAAHSG